MAHSEVEQNIAIINGSIKDLYKLHDDVRSEVLLNFIQQNSNEMYEYIEYLENELSIKG